MRALKIAGRGLAAGVGAAAAVGAFASRHRIISSLAVLFLLAGIGAGGYLYAAGPGSTSDGGNPSPGSHDWLDVDGDIEAQFCAVCHGGIAAETASTETNDTHPLTTCLSCHRPGSQGTSGTTGGHVAEPAKCAYCHSDEAGQIGNDAHASMLVQLGEDTTNASWTCKACHTNIAVNVTSVAAGPLDLSVPSGAP